MSEGKLFTTQFTDDVDGKAVQALAIAAAAELASNFADAEVFRAAAGDKAIWLEDGYSIVALLIWRPDPSDMSVWIGMAWTTPGRRNQGLYRHLYRELETLAMQRGFKKVYAGINPSNAVSRRAHAALGMRPLVYVKELGA